MKASKALVLASIAAYGVGIAATLSGSPPIADIPANAQIAMMAGMGGLLSLHLKYPRNEWLKIALTLAYGGLAAASFGGLQKWNWSGQPQPILGPAMAAWDLALAVAVNAD